MDRYPMTPTAMEDLLELPEKEALTRHLVGTNYQRLRFLAGSAAVIAFAFLLVYLFASAWLQLLAPAAILALARMLFSSSEEKLFFRYPRILLFFWLLALFAAAAFAPSDRDLGFRLVGVLGPLIVAFFRMPALDLGALLMAVLAGTLWAPVSTALASGGSLISPRLIVQTIVSASAFYFSLSAWARAKTSFRQRFRIAESQHRERQRMRQELASARQIQLSMLPRRDPNVAGLDIAAASLPATEVGGDYFEYFEHSDQELAVVVGDVAGHGVASGLLLSGLRSCLYLLHGDGTPPHAMFERLDRMVRDTTERRRLITLLYSIFDLEEKRLTVVAAGHPPPLHYRRASHTIEEVSAPALPLGTRLGGSFVEKTVDIAPGDVVLLYTDGVTETQNRRGDAYGTDRLRERLLRSARDRKARNIREDLLSDVWTFKGDAEQLDDITLIAVRLDPSESSLQST